MGKKKKVRTKKGARLATRKKNIFFNSAIDALNLAYFIDLRSVDDLHSSTGISQGAQGLTIIDISWRYC